MERRAVIILGPTASGKTHVTLKLSGFLKSEIISADSRQFYKYLNIGTAKPSQKVLDKYKHHFIDHLEPEEDYNASKFEKEALAIIGSIFSRGKVPVVAGGSGLYIKALVDGISDSVDVDREYRNELLRMREEKGNHALYYLLEECDPVSAKKMLPQNWKRVIRALEVYKLSGKYIWQIHEEEVREKTVHFNQYGLRWNRSKLYDRINERVEKMFEDGLVEETKSIISKGYSKKINSLNTVGYKEVISYIDGEITLQRAIELIQRNTRRYAKRQLTWFNADKRIKWIDIENDSGLDYAAELIYNDFRKYNRQ
ncbi:MAG: tRNA (adenosine(37)-N6)-dimethylallyltransferase MiaA [Melioribacteraceae bacterium]|nr:tRNA (adenosine(37)-N6)-dimethylallyltransferase MiaA [Melioribacteraceae bacterium]